MVKVKVCGLTTPADAVACVAAGVDYVGLNFHPPSPRFVTVERATEIVATLDGRAEPVALFVDRPASEVASVARAIGTDLVQLHGSEPPGYLSEYPGLRSIRAFRLAGPETLAAISGYLAEADRLGHPPFAILVDAHVPGLPGGTGVTIGDDLLSRLPIHPRIILAGGLTPENLADRIARARPRPWMVDTASGVESSPGIKDEESVIRFVREANGDA